MPKSAVVRRVTNEMLAAMREQYKCMDKGLTHDERASRIAPSYPQFSVKSLVTYSRVTMNTTERVWAAFLEKRLSLCSMEEYAGMPREMQDYLIAEHITRMEAGKPGFTPMQLVRVKKLIGEGMPYVAAIGRVTGEIQDVLGGEPMSFRSLEQLLNEIAKVGARWRAMVSMALDSVTSIEQKEGITALLIEKTYLLRHAVAEQHDFLNQKFNRFLGIVRKRVNAREAISPNAPDANENKG